MIYILLSLLTSSNTFFLDLKWEEKFKWLKIFKNSFYLGFCLKQCTYQDEDIYVATD